MTAVFAPSSVSRHCSHSVCLACANKKEPSRLFRKALSEFWLFLSASGALRCHPKRMLLQAAKDEERANKDDHNNVCHA